MMARFRRSLNSREMRKLRRDKGAMVALVVIGLYTFVALAVMCNAISLDDCTKKTGPINTPGFYAEQSLERRFEVARTSLLKPVSRALLKSDPQQALSEIELGRWRVADKSIEELQAIVDRARAVEKIVNTSEFLDKDPAMLPKLEEFENVAAELAAPLSGWDQFMQDTSMFLGTDSQGRSILFRGIYSIKVALQIGIVTALISVLIGTILGAAAGYFGGWVDTIVVWVYTTFSSIPNLILLVVIAYSFTVSGSDAKDTLLPVYIAFCATFWIGTCRVVRGETMKLKQLEYIQAARTAGFGNARVLFRHILPNTSHLMLINFSLLLIGSIKSEVILSFLGLGVKSQPSWGIMIRNAGDNGDVMSGFFWQIGAATFFMFFLVLAFNVLSDALQDAFDPKHL